MFHRYQYESDIYPSLSRIPLHVRMKLDVTGIKISLKDWLAFSIEERTVLCHLPVETEEEKQVFHPTSISLSRRYLRRARDDDGRDEQLPLGQRAPSARAGGWQKRTANPSR